MADSDVRDPSPTTRGRLGTLFHAGLIVAALAILFLFDPEISALYAPCPFRWLSGLNCPGCGTLRGLHRLLHGDVAAAAGLNLLMVVSLPFLGYASVSKLVLAVSGRSLPRIPVSDGWTRLLLPAIVSFWILRNVPAYPFSLLAP